MEASSLKSLAWLIAAALPLMANGGSSARQEYQAVLRSKPEKAHGEKLFATCATCHGSDGGGMQDGRVPAIAGQHFLVIVKELVDFRQDKRWDALMEHYSDAHNLGDAQDLADVAAFISDLYSDRAAGIGDGEHLRDGAKTYARSCASCHGPDGEGNNARGYPRLAGQHYVYLLRQMENAVQGRRPNFSTAHVRLLARLDRSDFEVLADYLSRAAPRKVSPRY